MPLLPLKLSQSPLLSGNLGLSSDFFATLVAQVISPALPSLSFTPSQRVSPPVSKQNCPLQGFSLKQDKPLPGVPPTKIPPKQIIALLDLLERMDDDVGKEVQRVRESIGEARHIIMDHREEQNANDQRVEKRRDLERRETKGVDDEFWLNA